MKIKEIFAKLLTLGFYDPKWRCNGCGREMFGDGFFCDKCEKELPYNNKTVCDHCGREIVNPAGYCSTCKENMVSVDKARSVFKYAPPISGLIMKAKYENGKYILDYFACLSVSFTFATQSQKGTFIFSDTFFASISD